MRYRGAAPTALLLVLLGTALGGCAGSRPSAAPAPTNSGLRGQAVTKADCTPAPAASSLSVVGQVRRIRICGARRNDAATEVKTDGPTFDRLKLALEAADEPTSQGTCLTYGVVPRVIYAETDRGTYVLHIPSDGCGHYQGAAIAALGASEAPGS